MIKLPILLALGIFAHCILSTQALFKCSLNSNTELNEKHPLLLRQNNNEFFYPNKCNSNNMKLRFCETVRVVCPAEDLQVNNRKLNRTEANLKCFGANYFRLGDNFSTTRLRDVACSRPPLARLTKTVASCPNGDIGRIGFPLPNNKSANIVDRICHNEALGQTHWAHHRLPGSIGARQLVTNTTIVPIFTTGPFYTNISINHSVFSRDSQRARLLELLNDQAQVDEIIPADSNNVLVPGMLAPVGDMFYREQQRSVYYYANTVPIWMSVRDGNWKLVEDIVRGLAKRSCRILDVYSGGLEVLSYTRADNTSTSGTSNSTTTTTPPNTTTNQTAPATSPGARAYYAELDAGQQVEFTLTTSNGSNPMGAVPVPKYVFKYVIDRSSNQGLAFVTLNDPKIKNVPAPICDVHSACTEKYNEFSIKSRGYTYCCLIGQNSGFAYRAMDLGMPTFPNARPFNLDDGDKDKDPWNSLLGFLPPGLVEKINGVVNPTSTTTEETDDFFDDDDDEF